MPQRTSVTPHIKVQLWATKKPVWISRSLQSSRTAITTLCQAIFEVFRVMFFFVAVYIFSQRLLLIFLQILKIEPRKYTIRVTVPLWISQKIFCAKQLRKHTQQPTSKSIFYENNFKTKEKSIKFYSLLTLTHPALLIFVVLSRFHPNVSIATV